MGLSIALLEELHFDESGVITSDWRSYPILNLPFDKLSHRSAAE